MHLADTLIIAAYMITLVGIGILVAGRQKTTDSYFVAGLCSRRARTSCSSRNNSKGTRGIVV